MISLCKVHPDKTDIPDKRENQVVEETRDHKTVTLPLDGPDLLVLKETEVHQDMMVSTGH